MDICRARCWGRGMDICQPKCCSLDGVVAMWSKQDWKRRAWPQRTVPFYEEVFAMIKYEMEVREQFLIKLQDGLEKSKSILNNRSAFKTLREIMDQDVKEVTQTCQSINEKLEQLDKVSSIMRNSPGWEKDSPRDRTHKRILINLSKTLEEVRKVVDSLAGMETQSTHAAESESFMHSVSPMDRSSESMISIRERLEGLRMVNPLPRAEIQRADAADAVPIKLEGMPKVFTYSELSMATGGFSEKLGDGGFGSVYRGVLASGTQVAVKRMNADSIQSQQAMREFKGEISIISQLRHRNLIELRGWCEDQTKMEYMLVYELMPNGSLDKLLFDPMKSTDPLKPGAQGRTEGREAKKAKWGGDCRPVLQETTCLSWPKRFNIVTGIADALHYLHQGWKQQIIHSDIKCDNILLDKDWNAKLTDFGQSRVVDHQAEAYTVPFIGTNGYAAPELFTEGKFTDKSDVFAFGVVLLEVACGRRNWTGHVHELTLVTWVKQSLSECDLLCTVDKKLRDYDIRQVKLVLKIGLACCDLDSRKRPSMRLVIKMLAGERQDELQKMMMRIVTPKGNGMGERRLETEWVERDEPGVYVTLQALPGGGRGLKRVRFSRKRFSEQQAEHWWAESRRRVLLQYNVEGLNEQNANATSSSSRPGGEGKGRHCPPSSLLG